MAEFDARLPGQPGRLRNSFRAACVGALAAGLLPACAAPPERAEEVGGPAILVSGLEIRNDLPYPVDNVMIRVPATGAFAGCGSILSQSVCANRFEDIDYRNHPVSISWSERGQHHTTGEFRIERPEHRGPDTEYRVLVVVFAPGQAGARYVPADENPERPH